MDFWPSSRWKIAICSGSDEQWIEPALPFALLGSHPCCTARIDEPRIPAVAYIACCFEDSIEVWPTCPIAFPRWGEVEPEHQLLVGKKRLSLVHQKHRAWQGLTSEDDPAPEKFPTVGKIESIDRKITIDWDGVPRSKLLSRRVMIIGDDHPSTIRLHQQNLQRCDHAVISVGGSAWIVNLHPGVECDGELPLVSRLLSTSEPVKVGNVSIRLGRAVPKRNTRLQLPQTLTTAAAAQVAGDAGAGNQIAGAGAADAALRDIGTDRRDGDTQHRDSDPPPRPAEHQGPLSPELLTSDVTARLVSIDNAKFRLVRGVKFYLFSALFGIGMLTVSWVFIQFILPWILVENSE